MNEPEKLTELVSIDEKKKLRGGKRGTGRKGRGKERNYERESNEEETLEESLDNLDNSEEKEESLGLITDENKDKKINLSLIHI